MNATFRVCAAALIAFAGYGLWSSVAAQSGETADESLKRALNLVPGGSAYIAPMTKAGDRSAKGANSAADGSGVFSALLARSGINPGVTEPKELRGREGFLEFIDQSIVLNERGTRATFGYFVMGGGGKNYFVLFSYDHIKTKDDFEREASLFAFEVFLFGPGEKDDPGPLRRGLAVGADGRLLDKVPLELARVSNVLGKEKHDGEPVKPGVDDAGKGCLVCHARKKGDAQATLPFPWIRSIDPCLVGTWQAKSVTALTAFAKPSGGEGFRITFEADGTQIADYANMKPFEWSAGEPGHHGHIYRGKAKARITTEDKVAQIESLEQAGATLQLFRRGDPPDRTPMKLPSLGPGGLGTTANDNGYVCNEDSLAYKTSIAADKHPTHSVKLTRMKN
jgi:hypothetical protein